MFDSHCHLDFDALKSEFHRHLDDARAVGVTGWLVPGTRPEQWNALSQVAREDVWVGVGLHPWETGDNWDLDALLAEMRDSALALGAVCLGECGLDKGKGGSLERQCELLEAQLKLAGEMELPVVLHQVGHQEAFLRCLQRVGLPDAGGVVHGFGGDAGWGRALSSRGLFLGVGVGITSEIRKKLRLAIQELPLDRLLLETDAPDQKPDGVERFGVPADLALVCQTVGQLKGVSAEVVAETTEQTTRALFRVSEV